MNFNFFKKKSKSNTPLISMKFWQERYSEKGNSGTGSYGELATFKINFINDFIESHKLKSLCDFGYGDCNVAKNITINEYTGIDISDSFLSFKNSFNARKVNLITSPFDKLALTDRFEIVTCLDVLYHILENEEKYLHKTLDRIYDYSKKFIIIYAQDSYDLSFDTQYKNHLHNSKWRQYLEKKPINLISHQEKPLKGSSAQFFVYEKN